MRVMVIGLRGIPDVQGGIETHAEHLYPLLVKLGCEVEVVVRSAYVFKTLPRTWKGIDLKRIWSPKMAGLEAFIHTFIAVLYASVQRPDILHIHAVGPAIMTPLARILGLRVVITHHGPDYDREKWGHFARWLLRTGERLGMQWSHKRIVISQVIQDLVKEKYDQDSVLIPNAVTTPSLSDTQLTLSKFNLTPEKYILQVSRLVPEKRQLDLIRAFSKLDNPEWKLVLTGAINKNERYTKELMSIAQTNKNIVLTDYQSGLSLQEIYTNAGIFVLPSSNEGLAIAILEALSYGLRVIASNIPANLEIKLPKEQYFQLGDTDELAHILQHFVSKSLNSEERNKIRAWVSKHYNWQDIAEQTMALYKQTIST